MPAFAWSSEKLTSQLKTNVKFPKQVLFSHALTTALNIATDTFRSLDSGRAFTLLLTTFCKWKLFSREKRYRIARWMFKDALVATIGLLPSYLRSDGMELYRSSITLWTFLVAVSLTNLKSGHRFEEIGVRTRFFP